jgi:hypothetical protein
MPPPSGEHSAVSDQLAAFLAARDLDDLAQAFAALEEVVAADADAIAELLSRHNDRQAIANLLMYPTVIPDRLRWAAVRSALDGERDTYLALSATIGLQSLDEGAVTESQRLEVVSALMSLIRSGGETVAARAAGVIGRYLPADQAPRLVGLLDRAEDLVRHNVLAALIDAVGPEAVVEVIANAGRLTDEARDFVARQLCADHGFGPDGTVDTARVILSGVATPLLAYLPNLDDT